MVGGGRRRGPRAILLGTSTALATARSDHTYLVCDLPAGPLLVDCAGAPAHRLLALGLDPLRLQGILLTHAHADHLYGLPSLLQHLWLAQPEQEVPVLGLEETLTAARLLVRQVFALETRVRWLPVPPEEGFAAWQLDGLTLRTSPVRHSRPCLGLRLGSLAYSGDTGPCPEVVRLARGAKTLLHEATVLEPDAHHSTLEEAARAAEEAGVEELIVVHTHPRWEEAPREAREEASRAFSGRFRVGRSGEEIPLGPEA